MSRPVNAAPRPTPPASEDALRVVGLEKTYPNGTRAVQGVSFAVRRGEIFGLLGPNGAGKSTAIGVLGTLVRPTGGHAFVDGLDVTKERNEVRRRIGFAMQEAGVDELATGREFLVLQGRLYGLDKATARTRTEKLLRLFGIADAADKRIQSYSGGMKRRIDLASALIHMPRILFLDEPTEGLDPRSRRQLWDTLRRLNDRLRVTILLSTHYMEEADRLCHRLAILDRGTIVAQGTPAQLKADLGGQSVVLEYVPAPGPAILPRVQAALAAAGIRAGARLIEGRVHVMAPEAAQAAPRILQALHAAALSPHSLRIQEPTLDDVYLHRTGRTLAAAEEASPA